MFLFCFGLSNLAFFCWLVCWLFDVFLSISSVFFSLRYFRELVKGDNDHRSLKREVKKVEEEKVRMRDAETETEVDSSRKTKRRS
jgi:hypothetical protein